MTNGTRGLAISTSVSAVLSVLPIGIRATLRARLPDPVATHFTFAGVADGFMPKPGDLLVMVACLVAVHALLIATVRPGRVWTTGHRLTGSIMTGVTGLLAGVFVMATLSQVDLVDAAQARLPLWHVLAALAAAAVIGAATYALLPPGDTVPDGSAPALDLPTTASVSWSSSDFSALLLALSVVMMVAGVVSAWLVDPAFVVVAAVGLLLTSMSVVHVTVDASGVRWRTGLGVVGRRLPLEEISRVRAVNVEPMQYGGWGIRVSPHGWGVILRRGPGLSIDRPGKATWTITVPDAAMGAAVANALLARRR